MLLQKRKKWCFDKSISHPIGTNTVANQNTLQNERISINQPSALLANDRQPRDPRYKIDLKQNSHHICNLLKFNLEEKNHKNDNQFKHPDFTDPSDDQSNRNMVNEGLYWPHYVA